MPASQLQTLPSLMASESRLSSRYEMRVKIRVLLRQNGYEILV
jgi:hypothetical protein